MTPAGRHRAVEAAEQTGALLAASGMPRMPARMLAALLAAPDGGYTAADLADRLGVSPAAVSGAVRYLQTIGVARRVTRRGERRDRYELIEDTLYSALVGRTPLYERLAALTERIAAESEHAVRASDMARFFRFLSERMPALLEEWERVRDEGPDGAQSSSSPSSSPSSSSPSSSSSSSSG